MGTALVGAEEIKGVEGVGGAHGVVIADGEEGKVEAAAGDQAHVGKEGGVAGVVKALAIGGDDDAAGGAGVLGRDELVEAGAVERDGEGDAAEGEIVAAAGVHAVGGEALGGVVFGDLEVGDDGGVEATGERGGVAGVIGVAVGEEDVVAGDFVGGEECGGVAGEEGIDEETVGLGFDEETGVAVGGEFHGARVWSEGRKASSLRGGIWWRRRGRWR